MKILFAGALAVAAVVTFSAPASAEKYCNKHGECVKAPRPGYVVVAPPPVYIAPAPVIVKEKKPDVVIKVK
ncbi:hypothetical protein [Prosthecomicrobium sp. N25]|uniref:hypothetical protein n=1 Tax=Prosthecomicrobium sp. N25 TaxID=3129254 RepID=UPI003076BEB0